MFIVYDKEFPAAGPLGIQISEHCLVSTRMFSLDYPIYDASVRGLHEYRYRLLILTEQDMNILREHHEEFNALLKECQAHFLMPTEGTCLQRKTTQDTIAEPVDFVTGEPVSAKTGWALYRYL